MTTPTAPTPRRLFRQEAVDAQREKLLGEVSLARAVPLWVFTATFATIAAALVVYVFTGEIQRRERVEGFLAPDAGAARILAPEAGTLTELLAREGQEVEAGAPIARLSFERATASGATPSELVQREMRERVDSIDSEKTQTLRLAQQEVERARVRIDNLRKELAQADAEARLQNNRVAAARSELQRVQELNKSGFFSESKVTEVRNDLLDQQVKLQTMSRQRAALERDLANARAELPTIETKARQQIDQLTRARSELQQNIVQEEARRETLLRAPIAGTVTNIAAVRGQSLSAESQVAIVLPKGGGLQAQLLVPTRAIGFIQPGNEVVLRYEAFPFQRFGQFRGSVESISRTVFSAGEKIGQMTVREPVYRIDVRLERQTVAAGGQELALKPGMVASADILLEKRSIFEWVFEPVLEFRERLR